MTATIFSHETHVAYDDVYVRLYHHDEDFFFGEYHYHTSGKVNMNNVYCKSWNLGTWKNEETIIIFRHEDEDGKISAKLCC